LKFRISSNQGTVVTHADGKYDEGRPRKDGAYLIQTKKERNSFFEPEIHAAITCNDIDQVVVDRLMQHVHSISKSKEDIAEHERQAKQHRRERASKLAHMTKSINDIEKEQGGLT